MTGTTQSLPIKRGYEVVEGQCSMLGISLANCICRVLDIDPDLCRSQGGEVLDAEHSGRDFRGSTSTKFPSRSVDPDLS
jgi:hypothetical protein